jgi:hypothetical protein
MKIARMNRRDRGEARRVRCLLLISLGLIFQFCLSWDLSGTSIGQTPSAVVKFAVIGDSGTGDEDQLKVARQMVAYHSQHRFEFVITLGDNIYPAGHPDDYRPKFEIPYADLLKRGVKFYAALGNHDVRFNRRTFAINYPGFNMGGRPYYTFSQGNGLVQFFVLDSNTLADGRRDPAQLDWLRHELARSTSVWKIAYFHHPIYSSGKTHGSDLRLRAAVEPILIEGGVNLVFSGHDHIYERIHSQRGIYYFVSGSGGKLRRGDINPRTGLTAKGNDQVHHFMFIEIQDRSLRFAAISKHGEVLDQGDIVLPSSRVSGTPDGGFASLR